MASQGPGALAPTSLPRLSPAAALLPTSPPAMHTWHFSHKDLLTFPHSILALLLGLLFHFLSPFLFYGPFFLSFKTTQESLYPLSQPPSIRGRVHLLCPSLALPKLKGIAALHVHLPPWPMKSRTVFHLSIPSTWLVHNQESTKSTC